MIRRSPCEYYLKCLVVHPDGYSNDQIRSITKLQHLDFIGIPYLERLRATCSPPIPFYPGNPRHPRSQRFLIKEGIRALFVPDPAANRATELLDKPRAKEIIESSLLASSTDAFVAAALRKNGFACDATTIERYRHFYFNVGLVDSLEMKALIDMRTMGEPASDPDEKAANVALTKAHYSDPRRVAAKMSISPLAGLLNQMRMGFMPSSVELARIASAARTTATIRVLEELMTGLPERAQGFALTAKLMTEILESVGDAEEELYDELRTLALETEHHEIPHIKQLSDGSGQHTLDVQPTQEEIHAK